LEKNKLTFRTAWQYVSIVNTALPQGETDSKGSGWQKNSTWCCSNHWTGWSWGPYINL